MARDSVEKSKDKPFDNGIVNPNGSLIAHFAPAYLLLIPVTSFLTGPSGLLEKTITALIRMTPGLSATPPDRIIPALTALYIFFTFGATGAFSATSLAMSRPEGLGDNANPREHVSQMRSFPQRLRSAHFHLTEKFGCFAVAAAMAQILAPEDRNIVNLLGLHVLLKVGVHYPAYVLDVPPPRTFAHIAATAAALINVCWTLAVGARGKIDETPSRGKVASAALRKGCFGVWSSLT